MGIRQSVAALKPYLSRRIRIKFQSVQLLEVFPDGERGEIQAMTMTQLLAFVYAAIPDADVHRNAALTALAMAEKEGKKTVASSGESNDGVVGSKDGPGDHGSRTVIRQHRFVGFFLHFLFVTLILLVHCPYSYRFLFLIDAVSYSFDTP